VAGNAVEPFAFEQLHGFLEIESGGGFQEVGICAEFLSALAVGVVAGGGKNDDRQIFGGGLAANPFENLEAGTNGKIEVEQDETGKMIFAVFEISDGVAAVGNEPEMAGETFFFESAAHEENIVRFVLDVKNHDLIHGNF